MLRAILAMARDRHSTVQPAPSASKPWREHAEGVVVGDGQRRCGHPGPPPAPPGRRSGLHPTATAPATAPTGTATAHRPPPRKKPGPPSPPGPPPGLDQQKLRNTSDHTVLGIHRPASTCYDMRPPAFAGRSKDQSRTTVMTEGGARLRPIAWCTRDRGRGCRGRAPVVRDRIRRPVGRPGSVRSGRARRVSHGDSRSRWWG